MRIWTNSISSRETRRTLSFPRDAETFTWRNFFLFVDRCLRLHDRLVRQPFRQRAIRMAERWMLERMQGDGGLGGIFPAMANAVIALTCLGYPLDSPEVVRGLAAIEDLCLDTPDTFRVQPCLSPVWDTALTISTLVEAGLPPDHPALVRAGLWLLDRQTRCPGDWRLKAPGVQPGGWPFQFENEYYPDVDDTAVVLMSLRKIRLPDEEAKTRAIARGLNWILALQGSDGGWGAYDKDNNRLIFNKIPFADHGALMDPSTEDLAGRVLEALGYLGFRPDEPAAARAIAFRKARQCAGRLLVRALGRELPLRHVVRPGRPPLHRRGHGSALRAEGRRLAPRPTESGRGLGRVLLHL